MNLLDSAVKFSPEQGEFELGLGQRLTGDVDLSVCDYGIGIPMERRDRIFHFYYQAHCNDSLACGGRSGMGIGLFVSQ